MSAFDLNDETLQDFARQPKSKLLRHRDVIFPGKNRPPNVECVGEVTRRLLKKSILPQVAQDVILEIVQHLDPSDWLLFMIDDHFREHRFHQVRVALIAHRLLNTPAVWRRGMPRGGAGLRALTWAACICHDHAYTLCRLAKTMPDLLSRRLLGSDDERSTAAREERFRYLCACYRGLYSSELMESFLSKDAIESANSHNHGWVNRMIDENLGDWLSDEVLNELKKIPFNHGVWAAINLAKRLKERGLPPHNYLDCGEIESIETLLEAIAVHHMEELPQDNLVAGILVLADELQEWGRVTRGNAEEMVELKCDVKIRPMGRDRVGIEFVYDSQGLWEIEWQLVPFRKEKTENIGRLRDVLKGLRKLHVDCNAF
jgi:hypothetical protein